MTNILQNGGASIQQISSEIEGSSSLPIKSEEVVFRGFDSSLIKDYPRSNRKVSINYGTYGLMSAQGKMDATQSIHISPAGIEFQSVKAFAEGTLLRIMVNIPDYWKRKRKFVEYHRIDQPATFSILAKVVRSEDIGRRGKKKMVTVQTVIIDATDEMVLKSFLQEG
ncbi:MAG: hypothetical protein NTV34_11150 [Proteobacteria bacterium]|nr:hypothetical protein [Pseudomonadota bacterium]